MSRAKGMLGFVSALSGASLALFGLISLAMAALGWSLAGFLVGVALIAHGSIELGARSQFFAQGSERFLWRLFWNQIALAVSVGTYIGWQLWIFDPEAVATVLDEPSVQELLSLYPAETAQMLRDNLPGYVRAVYVLALTIAALGCVGMAFYYLNKGRAWLERGEEPS
ncbi:hypothetical protein [Pelagicoccus sp. SDUM812003]|uniref:hypothetical protein n=1 Tax=Pelagicoccus sp. SDUM812003 TaxID=3041267 RepID=UPI00280F6AA9|nr:hypothetical protein [Pelagicoccus sp. SDUM812003]MDQ8205324.1 hypothetical protein [Pelagicoccus sp. SDUM812003]